MKEHFNPKKIEPKRKIAPIMVGTYLSGELAEKFIIIRNELKLNNSNLLRQMIEYAINNMGKTNKER